MTIAFYTKVVHSTEIFNPFKAEVLRRVWQALTLKYSTFCPQSAFHQFLWIAKKENSDYFLTQYEIIHLLPMWTESLNVIQVNFCV